MQRFAAQDYQGGRLRFSARLGSQDCNGAVALWLRADTASGQTVAFDNLEANGVGAANGPITGTTRWAAREIVLDIPDTAETISIGIYLRGTGADYAAGFSVQQVASDVPVPSGGPLRAARQ